MSNLPCSLPHCHLRSRSSILVAAAVHGFPGHKYLALTCKAPSGLDLVYARRFKDYLEKVDANILDLYGWVAFDLVLLAVEGYLSFLPRRLVIFWPSYSPSISIDGKSFPK